MTVFRLLLPYARPYRGALAAGLGWLALTNVLAMVIPWLLKEGIDAAGSGTWPIVARAAVLLALAAVARGAARICSRWRFLHSARHLEVDLRQDLLARLLQKETEFFDRHRTGDLLSRFTNDLANLRMLAGFGLLTVGNAALVYLFSLVMLLTLSPTLTLIALLPYPLLLLGIKRLSRALLHRSTAVQEGLGRVSEAVEEVASGHAVIRACNLAGDRGRRFAALNDEYLQSNLALARLRALVLPIMTVVGPLASLLAFAFGGPLVIRETLSLGELVAFNAYLVQLSWPTLLLGWVLTLAQRAQASAERLAPLLAVPDEPRRAGTPPAPGPPAVVARGLNFAYDQRPILRDLSFELPSGTLIGVTGPTGSGKSTLLRLLGGFYPLQSGQLLIGDQDLAALDLRAHRQRLATVPQEGRLFTGTLRENLLFAAADAPDERLEQVAQAVALAAEVAAFPAGFATRVGEGGLTLSGGQRQRVALGRALAKGGDLWLLDDPFSHLDAATARTVWERLRPCLAGRTVVLVSSRVSLLAGADRILVLADGRLQEQGRHSELLAREGLYARLYRREQLRQVLEVAP